MNKKKTNISSPSLSNDVLEENWKRALADYKNLERRVDTEKQIFAKVANANLIARLLPSLDILELAATHNNQDVGVQLAAKQFREALTDEGLQLIEPQAGSVFDHNLHECSEIVDTADEKSENTISQLVLKGYKIGDYVLRPARVKVYKKKEVSPPIS